MKIAIIGTKGLPATIGGVERTIEKLAIEYVKQGHDVTVYSRFSYSKIKEKKFKYNGISVINIKTINTKRLDTLTYCFLSVLHASFMDYDIIALHQTVTGIFCFIPRLFGKTVVIHNHGLEFLGYTWNRLDKFVLKYLTIISSYFCENFTTVSISQKKICDKIFHHETIHIPNGFDPPKYEVGKVVKNEYILFVGRIVPEKGLDILIEAFNQITLKCNDELKLLIVGNTRFLEYQRYIMDKVNANKNILFLKDKYNDDLFKLYHEAKFILIPSRIESFCQVLFEALWLNGAVICSDIDQFKYTVSDYVVFFEQNNVESLKRKILLLLKKPEIVIELRKKAKTFPFEKYRWSNVASNYLNLYESILNKR